MSALLDSSRTQLESLQKEYESYRKKTRLATVKLQQELETERQQDRTDQLKSRVTELEAAQETLTREKAESENKLQLTRQELEARTTAATQLEREVAERQETITSLKEEQARLQKAMEEASHEAKRRVREMEAKLSAMEASQVEKSAEPVAVSVEAPASEAVAVVAPCDYSVEDVLSERQSDVAKLDQTSESVQPDHSESDQSDHTKSDQLDRSTDSTQPTNASQDEARINSPIGTNALLKALQSDMEPVAPVNLPYKEIEDMRSEIVSLRARLVSTEKYTLTRIHSAVGTSPFSSWRMTRRTNTWKSWREI